MANQVALYSQIPITGGRWKVAGGCSGVGLSGWVVRTGLGQAHEWGWNGGAGTCHILTPFPGLAALTVQSHPRCSTEATSLHWCCITSADVGALSGTPTSALELLGQWHQSPQPEVPVENLPCTSNLAAIHRSSTILQAGVSLLQGDLRPAQFQCWIQLGPKT